MSNYKVLIVTKNNPQRDILAEELTSEEMIFSGVSSLWHYMANFQNPCPDAIWICAGCDMVEAFLEILATKVERDHTNWTNPNLKIHIDETVLGERHFDGVDGLSKAFAKKGFPSSDLVELTRARLLPESI